MLDFFTSIMGGTPTPGEPTPTPGGQEEHPESRQSYLSSKRSSRPTAFLNKKNLSKLEGVSQKSASSSYIKADQYFGGEVVHDSSSSGESSIDSLDQEAIQQNQWLKENARQNNMRDHNIKISAGNSQKKKSTNEAIDELSKFFGPTNKSELLHKKTKINLERQKEKKLRQMRKSRLKNFDFMQDFSSSDPDNILNVLSRPGKSNQESPKQKHHGRNKFMRPQRVTQEQTKEEAFIQSRVSRNSEWKKTLKETFGRVLAPKEVKELVSSDELSSPVNSYKVQPFQLDLSKGFPSQIMSKKKKQSEYDQDRGFFQTEEDSDFDSDEGATTQRSYQNDEQSSQFLTSGQFSNKIHRLITQNSEGSTRRHLRYQNYHRTDTDVKSVAQSTSGITQELKPTLSKLFEKTNLALDINLGVNQDTRELFEQLKEVQNEIKREITENKKTQQPKNPSEQQKLGKLVREEQKNERETKSLIQQLDFLDKKLTAQNESTHFMDEAKDVDQFKQRILKYLTESVEESRQVEAKKLINTVKNHVRKFDATKKSQFDVKSAFDTWKQLMQNERKLQTRGGTSKVLIEMNIIEDKETNMITRTGLNTDLLSQTTLYKNNDPVKTASQINASLNKHDKEFKIYKVPEKLTQDILPNCFGIYRPRTYQDH